MIPKSAFDWLQLQRSLDLYMGNKTAKALLDAAKCGDIHTVTNLVKQGADKDKQDKYGTTPLAWAASDGHLDVVRYLVEQGADKDKQNKNGSTPLIWAAMNGHREVVKYLVEHGADKEKQDNNGDTPLTWAAIKGHLEVVDYLIEQGADKDKQDNDGDTPLTLARDRNLDMMRYLVEHGADKDKQDMYGDTPLTLAARDRNLDMVQYLVEQGTDKDKRNEYGYTSLTLAASSGNQDVVRFFGKQENDGYTPLTLAARDGNLDVVRYLVEQGADKDKQDMYGDTPLTLAARDGNLDVVRYLVEQGADKDKQDMHGYTPLTLAASYGHLEIVDYLVKQGANKEKQNAHSNIPLTLAASYGYLEIVEYLVEHGADKEKQENDGSTPLTLAARSGHLDVVRYLIGQGAGKEGRTSVLWAARNGNLNAIQNLVQNTADPTGIDKDGNTMLLLLLIRSDISEDKLLPVAKLLLEHGTPPLLSNNKGKSAKSVARAKGFHGIVKLVEEYAAKDPKWFIPPETIAKVNSSVLARGGFGEVYRAKWANSDVVVKEVAVVELRRFLKEVNTWRKLRHANVVPFYGANHRKEPFFIVSQYAANGELVEYLKREKEQGRILVWRKVKEVAAGLGYLHSQGVAHGDLKGNNIVVSDNGIAMLTDFGLRSLVKRKDELGAMAWRAPEFAHMTVLKPTRKSDVYSLGMCIIEAVTLKTPLSEYSNAKIRQFLRSGGVKVDKPDEMTEPQWNLVKQMIAVSPVDRPNLSDMVQKLEEFADDEQMEEAHARTTVDSPKDLMEITKLQVRQYGDAEKMHEEVNVGKTNLTCPECEWIASDGDSFCRMCGFYLLTDAVFA
ncbi:hypothetical protein V7S43_010308 [Phytophthora oleae]|uniref:Protein kinase domain-containing protein n=1 Tax=Phytophthora oleae TaxID=2107226 RepID=A0ABD3FG98_9STRA